MAVNRKFNSLNILSPQRSALEAAMWWSRESKIEAFAKRPDIRKEFAEAEPISQEIHKLLESKGVSTWTAIVALAACLGAATAVATQVGPYKGYLRFARRFVDSAFWAAYNEFKQSAKA